MNLRTFAIAILQISLGYAAAVRPADAQPGVYQSNPHTLFYLPMDGPNAGAPEGCRINNPGLLSHIPDRFGNPNSAIRVSAKGNPSDNFYIACSDTQIAASPSTNFTLGYWAQMSQFPNDGNCSSGCGYRIFTILATNGSNGGCSKYLAMDIGVGGGGDPDACQGGLNGNIGQFTSSTSVVDGAWHNLVWVFDHTNKAITLYLDGSDAGTGPLPDPPYSPKNTQYLAGAENGAFALNGGLDDVWIEDHAWTPPEVRSYIGVGSGPAINPGGLVNAASYTTPVAAGSIAAAYGTFGLSAPSSESTTPLPTSLGGLSLAFGAVQAPLFYASGGQVNLQVPWEMTGQSQAAVTAALNSQIGGAQAVGLAPYAPGIFSMNAQGTGQGAILDASYRLVDSSNPATPGSAVALIYCTGLGAVTNQPASGQPSPGSSLASTKATPTVTIGGAVAQVLFSGLAPGFVGEYQVNALVPAEAVSGDAVPVTISIGGVTSNTVTIAVQGPTGTGTLNVQITGLPAGTPVNVSITSTNGYSTTITTASASLQVPSGTYTITASPVAAGSVSYYANARQTVNVAPDATANAQIAYDTVIPNTTKVLDQTGTSTLTIASDGSTLTMSAQSAVAASLAPGDVLAAAPTSAVPHGLLRKIVSVAQAAGQVTATTTQAALTDAIQQANLQFSTNLLPQNVTSATALLPGVEVRVGTRPTGARTSQAGPLSAVLPMDTSDICANGQVVLTEMKQVEIASGLDVSGEIELCGNFTIQGSINWLGLQLNSLTAAATLAEHTDLSMTGQSAAFSGTQTIATIEFSDIVIPVGEIPLDFAPEIAIKIGASGAAGASFSVGVSQNTSVTRGFSYANGQVSPVLQSTPLTFQLEPLTVTPNGHLTATAFVEADIDLLLYHIAGPYFDPQAYLQFDADVLQNPWWTLSGGLKGPVGLQLNPDLDVLGFDNLPEVSFANLFDISQTFLQASSGFPSLQALTPNAAPSGSTSLTLTVTGSNFAIGSTVSFGGASLATTFVSPSELTATVPASDLASAGDVPVTVSNPAPGGGTSAPLNFTVQATANPQPAITSLSPSSASAGGGPLVLTINGSGFIASSTVTFNGPPHTADVVNSGQITIQFSAADLATSGSYPVVVSNPPPGGGSSNAATFVVQPASVGPTLTGFSLSASSVSAGGSVTGTVTLSAAAPGGGVKIAIQDSPVILQFTSPVTVLAGQTSATFAIGAPASASATSVTLTATLAGVKLTAALAVSQGSGTSLFENNGFNFVATWAVSGQSVPLYITTCALSLYQPGSGAAVVEDRGGVFSLSLLFDGQPTASGDTATFTGVFDGVSSFGTTGTGPVTSATLNLTVQSAVFGAAVTGTLGISGANPVTGQAMTLNGALTGTINNVGPCSYN